jgi:hypothetical protein
MSAKMHKLFVTRCDIRPDMPTVSAVECSACPHGSVVDGRSRVLCYGVTKFFTVPCCYDMRAGATLADCEKCPHGEVSTDRLRVFCDRL